MVAGPLPVANTAKVTVSGLSPQGEIWNTGFWLAGNVTFTNQTVAAETVAAINTALTTSNFYDVIKQGLSTDASITELRLDTYETRGPASNTAIFPLAITGTGSGSLPLQTCCVASLRTAVPGRSGRGRMYLPAYGRTMESHEFPAGVTQGISQGIASGFTAVNSSSAIQQVKVVVVSRVKNSTHPVELVIVDSRPDIQRRRANRETILNAWPQGVS